ncbi:MAG: hypothetical protein JST85_03060 [Acidobacteria bacterium]|nr:hypothetical protein [Acidobacteriota bacterium]
MTANALSSQRFSKIQTAFQISLEGVIRLTALSVVTQGAPIFYVTEAIRVFSDFCHKFLFFPGKVLVLGFRWFLSGIGKQSLRSDS